jgi:hypothetical protein
MKQGSKNDSSISNPQIMKLQLTVGKSSGHSWSSCPLHDLTKCHALTINPTKWQTQLKSTQTHAKKSLILVLLEELPRYTTQRARNSLLAFILKIIARRTPLPM